MHRREFLALGSASVLVPFWPALGQEKYPDRPIRMIVPFGPGGVVDVIARLWQDGVKDQLGTIVVENQGGGGGTIGAGNVARAQPDGYTVLLGNTSTQVLVPAAMAKPPYDPAKAFQSVAIVAISAVAFVVHPSVPAKTLQELILHIRATPNMSYGSPGAGTLTNLAGEMFKQQTGLAHLAHVPYRGAGPGIADLVGGHIPMMLLNITGQVVEQHRGGQLRIIAVCTPKRIGVLPDVPTAAETMPGFVSQLFTGLFVPAGTPQPIIIKLAEANRAAMGNAEFKKKLIESGFEPVLDTPAEAQRFVDDELTRLGPIIKSIGFKTD
jgi:tripartite-type tricarboxylate transporter receptor subunit TctC